MIDVKVPNVKSTPPEGSRSHHFSRSAIDLIMTPFFWTGGIDPQHSAKPEAVAPEAANEAGS